MESRKFASKKRYLIAFIMGTAAFILIFAVSYSLSYFELARISNLQSDVSYDIFADKLDYSFFNKTPCGGASFDKISKDLGFQGRIIDDLEHKLGKQNEGVLLRKQFYTLVELEHFEFVKLLNERCGEKVNTILFFYSNNDSELSVGEEAGRILGVVSSRHENLVIYSFDVDLVSDLVDKLEKKYNITETPSIIINEKALVVFPRSLSEIESHFIELYLFV